MVSIVSDDGSVVAVTLLAASPSTVTQIKTFETDGYNAVQLGFETGKRITKSLAGHFKKSKASPKVVREFRVDGELELTVGDSVGIDSFEVGDTVEVTGISKGKGFAGTIKRHNFHRGRKTHGGQSYRRPGSIGSMYPQRIFPGKKMAGRMGHDKVTVKNLKVALIDDKMNLIGVTGAVPGPRKGLVALRDAK